MMKISKCNSINGLEEISWKNYCKLLDIQTFMYMGHLAKALMFSWKVCVICYSIIIKLKKK